MLADRSVAEIAGKVGIHDVNYFYRLFKHLTGLTPGDYREQFATHTAAESGESEQA